MKDRDNPTLKEWGIVVGMLMTGFALTYGAYLAWGVWS